MTRRRYIAANILALKDLVPHDLYEDLLRAARDAKTEEQEAALIGCIAVIRSTRLVQAAALGEKTKRPNRRARRAAD